MSSNQDVERNTTLLAIGASAIVGVATIVMLQREQRKGFWHMVGEGAKNAIQTYFIAKRGTDMFLHRPHANLTNS